MIYGLFETDPHSVRMSGENDKKPVVSEVVQRCTWRSVCDEIYRDQKSFFHLDEKQYITIGAFWDEMAEVYGRENLMGLGCNWSGDSIEYVMALKEGRIADADYEIELPDQWTEVSGKTEQLSRIYDRIYKDGPLLYEIEEFDSHGNCRIRYCR